MRKCTFVFSFAPSGAFSFVCCPISHAARRVFILHAQTHVCVFIRAIRRVFIRWLSVSHAARRVFILHTQTHVCAFIRALPHAAEWVAEAGASRFPMNGGAGFPWSIRKTKSCPCRAGRNPCAAWSISSRWLDEICRLRLQTEKPAELSFCGLHLPWQLSTLAGPIVRLPSTC